MPVPGELRTFRPRSTTSAPLAVSRASVTDHPPEGTALPSMATASWLSKPFSGGELFAWVAPQPVHWRPSMTRSASIVGRASPSWITTGPLSAGLSKWMTSGTPAVALAAAIASRREQCAASQVPSSTSLGEVTR